MLIALTCIQKVCAIFMQSIGLAKIAAPLSFLRDILLILFAILIPLGLGVWGVVWAAPSADAAAIAITVPVMVWVWKKISALQRESGSAE